MIGEEKTPLEIEAEKYSLLIQDVARHLNEISPKNPMNIKTADGVLHFIPAEMSLMPYCTYIIQTENPQLPHMLCSQEAFYQIDTKEKGRIDSCKAHMKVIIDKLEVLEILDIKKKKVTYKKKV